MDHSVIHVPTRQDYEQAISYLEGQGFRFSSGTPLSRIDIFYGRNSPDSDYGRSMCLRANWHGKYVTHASRKYYEPGMDGYKYGPILSVAEFFAQQPGSTTPDTPLFSIPF